MDIYKLADRLGLEMEEFTELAALFLRTARSDLDKLRAAGQAKDTAAAAALAHSLKGSSGNLGFTAFSQLARTAEIDAKQADFDALDGSIEKMQHRLAEIENAIE